MKFGLFYEHQIPRPWTEDSEFDHFQNALTQIELADRLGYDYAWQVEHHFLEEYSHGSSPASFLGAASQRTKQIRLGHGVLQLTTNHPIRVAEMVATLDLLSDGRAEFGTGEGQGPTELHPFHARVREKKERYEEAIKAIIPCFTSTNWEFHGKHFDFPARNVIPKPRQKPHPPLWVACSNPKSLEYAAHRGMGALLFQFATPEGARAWVNRYYSILANGPVEKLADYATNPNIAVVSGFMCAKTDEEARARADGWTFFIFALEYNGKHLYEPGKINLWEEYQAWRNTDKAQRAFDSGLIGSPETIRRKLRQFADANVDQIILLNQSGKTTHAHICESLELFANEVMPEFHEREPQHQEWKRQVLSGEIVVDHADADNLQGLAAVVANPEIGYASKEELQARTHDVPKDWR